MSKVLEASACQSNTWSHQRAEFKIGFIALDSARLRFGEIAVVLTQSTAIPDAFFSPDARGMTVNTCLASLESCRFPTKTPNGFKNPWCHTMPSWRTSPRMLYEDLRMYILILGKSHEYMLGMTMIIQYHIHLAGLPSAARALTGCNHCITWLCHLSGLSLRRQPHRPDMAGPDWTRLDRLHRTMIAKRLILPSDLRRGEALIHLPSTWWVWGLPALK